MKDSIDLMEFMSKLINQDVIMINDKEYEQKDKTKIKCYFVCKNGYSKTNCRCLNK